MFEFYVPMYILLGIGYVLITHILDDQLKQHVEPGELSFWISISVIFLVWPVSLFKRYLLSGYFWKHDVKGFLIRWKIL